MKPMQEIMIRLVVAALLPIAQGCAALAAPPVLMISMASTVVGGLANSAVMGGSTVGVIHNVAFGDRAGGEQDVATVKAKTVVMVAVAKVTATPRFEDTATPQFASGLERACYFRNASGRGLPCT